MKCLICLVDQNINNFQDDPKKEVCDDCFKKQSPPVGEKIVCPVCGAENNPEDGWDFSDGEERKLQCDNCDTFLKVTINRPIEYVVEIDEEKEKEVVNG